MLPLPPARDCGPGARRTGFTHGSANVDGNSRGAVPDRSPASDAMEENYEELSPSMVSQSAGGGNCGHAAYAEINGNAQYSSNAQHAEASGQERFTGFGGPAGDGTNL